MPFWTSDNSKKSEKSDGEGFQHPKFETSLYIDSELHCGAAKASKTAKASELSSMSEKSVVHCIQKLLEK